MSKTIVLVGGILIGAGIAGSILHAGDGWAGAIVAGTLIIICSEWLEWMAG